MDYDKIKELIEAVSKSNLTRFEVEEGGLKISMRTDKDSKNIVVAASQTAAATVAEPMVQTAAVPQVEAVSYTHLDLGRGNLGDSAYMGSVTEDYQCS